MTAAKQVQLPEHADVTALLRRFTAGDREAAEELFQIVMQELKRIAISKLRSESGRNPLQPTELVNLAYVKLADRSDRIWTDRRHFFNFSSKVMHHVLIDLARHENAGKGAGKWVAIPLEDDLVFTDCNPEQLLDVSRALERLRLQDARMADIIERRFYSDLTNVEIAEELGTCTKTISRDLKIARAWLKRELSGAPR